MNNLSRKKPILLYKSTKLTCGPTTPGGPDVPVLPWKP